MVIFVYFYVLVGVVVVKGWPKWTKALSFDLKDWGFKSLILKYLLLGDGFGAFGSELLGKGIRLTVNQWPSKS